MLIICALVVTAISTVSSLVIYKKSGAYRFDLSRPGYEDVRAEVKNDDDELAPYPTSGPLNAKAIQDFRDRYNKITESLDKMNDFDVEVLNDENLGFEDSESPDHMDENLEQH